MSTPGSTESGGRDFVARLRALDARLQDESLRPGAGARIGAALADAADPKRTTVRWGPLLAFAAGAAMVIAFFAWRMPAGSSGEPATPLARASVGAFELRGDQCTARTEGDAIQARGDCRLVAPHMRVQTWEPVVLSAEGDVVRIHQGRAMFDVDKVPDSRPPVRVEVSHGAIEVLGTRFEVEQNGDGGRVDLFEGRIRFEHRDGTVTNIVPGQRFWWGAQRHRNRSAASVNENDAPVASEQTLDDEIEIEVEQDARRPQPPQPPQPRGATRAPSNSGARGGRASGEAAALIERVEAMRSAGRHREAAAVLENALHRSWDRRTAQVLSYELGELLHRHLRDSDRACRHLARHQIRYPHGIYSDAVAHTQARLSCDSRDPLETSTEN